MGIYSNPNNGPFAMPVQWNEYNTQTRQYMELKPNSELVTETADILERFNLWINVLRMPGPQARMSGTPERRKVSEMDVGNYNVL